MQSTLGSDDPLTPVAAPITVSALNERVRGLIERQIPALWVVGEISNFTRAPSGHCYFVLKDAQAQVRCTLFRQRTAYLSALPKNGDSVEVRALASFYEPRGEFQLNVEFLRLAGVGRLYEAFERLKAKLMAQGLFDQARKRALPKFARCVGVVTSPNAAALHDVLTTLRRRMPSLKVILYPTLVQGAEAAAHIVRALDNAGARAECDVLVLCRGGGSIEDLWPFNEELVAMAIARSPIPVVSGVGHETDFTIADFVADARAPTPTAAAVLVSPERAQLVEQLRALALAMGRQTRRALETRMQRLDALPHRLVHPMQRLALQRRNLDALAQGLAVAAQRQGERLRWDLTRATNRWLAVKPALQPLRYRVDSRMSRLLSQFGAMRQSAFARLDKFAGKLESLDPNRVLERGYSIVWDDAQQVVVSARQLHAGEHIFIQFAQGRAHATVNETK